MRLPLTIKPWRCLNLPARFQIVRPLESIAETQPQLQPDLLRLSAIISEYVIRHLSTLTS
jgi:hypothetical protein